VNTIRRTDASWKRMYYRPCIPLGIPMNTAVRERPRWPVKMTRVAFVVGVLAIILLLIAGPAYRLRLLPLVPALLGAAIGFLSFVIAFIVGAIGLLAGGRHAFARSRAAVAVIALSLVVRSLPDYGFPGTGAPPIHDVTTDLTDPPMFKDALPLRSAFGAANPAEYQRIQSMRGKEFNVSDAQRVLTGHSTARIAAASRARISTGTAGCERHGLGYRGSRSVRGRVEATDTTSYFGFKDDVVVRVLPAPTGSRVDVRSESRVGLGDAGPMRDVCAHIWRGCVSGRPIVHLNEEANARIGGFLHPSTNSAVQSSGPLHRRANTRSSFLP